MAKKKKKQKKPNIPVQTMARPQLEQVLIRRERDELDDDEFVVSIQALMQELGQEAILNALIGLLENAGNERKDALMVAIPRLGNKQTVGHLWHLVRRSKMSIGAKMTALVILKQMGEDVNLDDPGEYLSWRDIKQADVSEIADMGRFGMQAIIKELQKLDNADEVEALMMRFEEMMTKTGGQAIPIAIIEDLIAMNNSDAADMLAAITATTTHQEIRETARKGLLKLAGYKVFPQSEIIKSLRDERFYAAYSSDPAHPWQQQVSIVFERGQNLIQALVFLLDFGHPWNGAIKDFFPTQGMTPNQFQREFINKANRQGVEQRKVPYARARQFVLDALEANHKNRIKLPPEFDKFRHWVERRIIDPSPELLAYAEQVDAHSTDEWGTLMGKPVRGMEVIGPDGKPMPVMVLGDLDDPDWDDDNWTFDDLLNDVNDYFLSEGEEPLAENEEPKEHVLPYEWAVSYLATRYEEGVDLEELDDRWENLCDFMFYLEEDDTAPSTPDNLKDIHLSRFITDFWDQTIASNTPLNEKIHALETVQDFYEYLAAQKYVPVNLAHNVTEAVSSLMKHKNKLTPLHH